MIQPQSCIQQRDPQFSDKNVWSSLKEEFKGFESRILEIVCQQKNSSQFDDQNIHLNLSDMNKDKVKTQIRHFQNQIKVKLSKILFNCSINQSQASKNTNRISELETQVKSQKLHYQIEVKELKDKINAQQKLLKVYERALGQNKITPTERQKSNSQKDIAKSQMNISHSAKYPLKALKSLKFEKTYCIKIEGKEKTNQISESNLSYSRLTSSRMSSSRLDGCALRQLQSNWNKSVNLSSKSLKSANKDLQKSVKKEDKPFAKSHIKERDLNKSAIKENQNSTKINRENRLNQSMISQFCLNKN